MILELELFFSVKRVRAFVQAYLIDSTSGCVISVLHCGPYVVNHLLICLCASKSRSIRACPSLVNNLELVLQN